MWRLLVLAASLAALPVSSALAQDTAAQFYKGRQVNVIVGSSAGGGYDIYARLLARHMGKHIPGNPTMVVSNMAGAGSNAAAAHVYNVAPKDGTVIGALQNTIILESLLDTVLGETKRQRHDATKFIQLGSATIDHYVCIVRADAPVKSFRELLAQELIIGASQPGTSTRDFPAMLNNMTGSRIRLVSGYPGTREITLAIEKDEVKGLCGFSWSSLAAQRPDWLKSGFIRVLVQEHDKGHPDINRMGVPLAVDFAKTAGKPPGDGIDLQLGNVRPPLHAAARRAGGAGGGAAPGVHGDDARPGAPRRGAADRARHRSDLGRGIAGAGGENLRHPDGGRRAGQAGADLQGAVSAPHDAR
jgi:tripartite-type tricarboxylate transporter receptor subunit TctC